MKMGGRDSWFGIIYTTCVSRNRFNIPWNRGCFFLMKIRDPDDDFFNVEFHTKYAHHFECTLHVNHRANLYNTVMNIPTYY